MEVVGVPTWRIASIKVVGRDASSVADQLLRGVLSVVRWFAKVATKSIWKKGAGCRTFGSVLCVATRGALSLVSGVALRFVVDIPNTIARLRDQMTEGLVENRAWALFVASWSTDSLNLSRWGSLDQR